MATLSVGDLTNLRTKQPASKLYFNILRPHVLLSAQVNGSFSRGARSIDYDNGTATGDELAAIQFNQTMVVYTADGVKRVRVKSITGTTAAGSIVLAENAIEWTNNDVIEILHIYDIWTIPPTIRSGIFYKDYNIIYAGQNLTPPPVAIAGGHRAGFLSSGSIVFNLDASDSYAIAQGATISSYLWSCLKADGTTAAITIASAASATTTLTITAAGQYWLRLIVTDSNGETQTTYRCVWVNDANNPPITDFNLQSLTGSWSSGGWRMSVQVYGDDQNTLTLDNYPDGTLCLVWYQNYLDGVEGYVNLWGVQDNTVCAGYFRTDNDSDNVLQQTGEMILEITTPENLLDNTTDFGSVSIVTESVPATWYQYATWLTIGRAIHHELRWHTTVMETCDVYGLTDNILGISYADFTESSILQRVNGLAYSRGIFAKLMSDRLGRLHLAEDSQMLNDAGRAALDTVYTITESDILTNVDYVRTPEGKVSAVEMDGFYYNGSSVAPFISMAAGYIEGGISYAMPEFRGIAPRPFKNQALSGQTDCNEKAGRALALENITLKELRIKASGNYLGAYDIIPSIGWYLWGIANNELQRELEIFGTNFVCRSVTANWQNGGVLTVDPVMEPEVFGPDGIKGNYPVGYPTPVTTTPPAEFAPPEAQSVILPTGDFYITVWDDLDSGNTKAAGIQVNNSAVGATETIDNVSLFIVSPVVLSLSTSLGLGFRQDNSSFDIYGFTLGFSGLTTTSNTPAVLAASADYLGGAAKISQNKALLVYSTGSSSMVIDLLSVSGGVISIDSTENLSTNASLVGDIASLSSIKAVAVWPEGASVKACVVNISGSTITLGTTYEIEAITADSVRIVALSPSLVVVSYVVGTAIGGGDFDFVTKTAALAISGDTITVGTPVTALTSSGIVSGLGYESGYKNIAALSSTDYLVLTGLSDSGGGNNYNVRAVMCNVSGTTVTVNAVETFLTDRNNETVPCVYIQNNEATIVYANNTSPTVVTAAITSTTVSDNNDDTSFASYMFSHALGLVYE